MTILSHTSFYTIVSNIVPKDIVLTIFHIMEEYSFCFDSDILYFFLQFCIAILYAEIPNITAEKPSNFLLALSANVCFCV